MVTILSLFVMPILLRRMATSGACCESKQLKMRPLAEDHMSQRRRHEHGMVDMPRPPAPSTNLPKLPTGQLNLPRCRGKLKSSCKQVSRKMATYPCGWRYQGQVGRVGSVESDPDELERQGECAGGKTSWHNELEATARATARALSHAIHERLRMTQKHCK